LKERSSCSSEPAGRAFAHCVRRAALAYTTAERTACVWDVVLVSSHTSMAKSMRAPKCDRGHHHLQADATLIPRRCSWFTNKTTFRSHRIFRRCSWFTGDLGFALKCSRLPSTHDFVLLIMSALAFSVVVEGSSAATAPQWKLRQTNGAGCSMGFVQPLQ
jgi:hypothetical protein